MASAIALGESSSQRHKWKYDVFLSFRGEDTRKNFTDHLYDALNRKGIVTFRDNPSLEKGHNISDELVKAIENSKYLVVIISGDYASSTWCLEELAKIVECVKGREQMAIPIFYNVDPSHVRKQIGSFENAFAKHEATFADNVDQVQRWKNAMKEIADLSGWDSRDRQYESHFIHDIVEDLQNKLGKNRLYAPQNLVGMESRIEDKLSHLSFAKGVAESLDVVNPEEVHFSRSGDKEETEYQEEDDFSSSGDNSDELEYPEEDDFSRSGDNSDEVESQEEDDFSRSGDNSDEVEYQEEDDFSSSGDNSEPTF